MTVSSACIHVEVMDTHAVVVQKYTLKCSHKSNFYDPHVFYLTSHILFCVCICSFNWRCVVEFLNMN